MKKDFMTGLALLLPIILTLIIVHVIINLLTWPFIGIVTRILAHYDLVPSKELLILIKLVILFLLIVLIIAMGYIAQMLFFRYVLRYSDYLWHRIPVFNRIYKAIQDVTHTLFATDRSAFSQVVLVPFPDKNTYCLGFISKSTFTEGTSQEFQKLTSIFVPGSPNPTFGYMLLYKQDHIVYLDISVEEAFKFILSFGIKSEKAKAAEKK